MFSYVMESGLQVKVALTPNNHVVLNLISLARRYSRNITGTAWGQTILGVPVNKLTMAEDMTPLVGSSQPSIATMLRSTLAAPTASLALILRPSALAPYGWRATSKNAVLSLS